jgi:TonB dependent receptor/Carboxypeptidase regulatory-like domain/TonB-dependent Receptor Plug Domain
VAAVSLLAGPAAAQAQPTATVTGLVRDRATQEPLIGASVSLENTALGTATDVEGRFRLTNIPPGNYNVQVKAVGYAAFTRFNVALTSGNAATLVLEPTAAAQQLGEATVTASRAIRVATSETPLSVQRLTSEEILTNPGGNFDISRTVQSLPGVGGGGTGGSAGFRNDIVIRGGAPNENVYYLDGIEVPVINHFATQGSAGGPAGILNVSFIEDVTLSSSAFEARYDNPLSSVLQFKQRDGSPERVQGNLRTSFTEAALTLEGPLGRSTRKDSVNGGRTTFLASVRRSYLQNFFELIDLPIRPAYWDGQFKITHKINPKTTLTFLGLGALDDFSVAVPKESSPEKDDILRSTPSFIQQNYTVGAGLRRLVAGGYLNVALSRTLVWNKVDQFQNRDIGNEAARNLLTRSTEVENKLRVDLNKTTGKLRWAVGGSAQAVHYDSRFFNRIRREFRDREGNILSPGVTVQFQNDLDYVRYGAFAQATRTFGATDRFSISAGLRTDGNTFTRTGHELWRTLSPRAALSYALTDRWNLNASIGQYYKIPPGTILGFASETGTPLNKDARYIRSTHYVAGLEFLPNPARRFTIEGFYKQYSDYPLSVRDGISLANLGGDFGSIGNEAIQSTGKGRSYGVELFAQQKLTRGLFLVFSYTYFRSEFSGIDGVFKPTAWDTRHLGSALLGRQFGKGWQMGLKYRVAGGAPYTPWDDVASRANFITTGQGIRDYTRLNTERLKFFQQFDFRLDKQLNFRRTSLDVYFDVTNAFVFNNPGPPDYTFQRNPADPTQFATTDGQPAALDGSNAIPVLLNDSSPLVVPTIGVIFQF